MTTIRPNLPPAPRAAQKPADAGRLAAQKAFFALAAGQAPSGAQAVQATLPTAMPAPVSRPVQASAEGPARPLRPGSLLDIRV